MEVFAIPIKKERSRPYRLLAWLILVINFLFFGMLAAKTRTPLVLISLSVSLLLLASWSLLRKLGLLKTTITTQAMALFLVLAMHFLTGYWWAALAMLALAWLYNLAMRPLVVQVTHERIEYPSLPRRRIGWQELNNLVLRDGILTVDFRNNRLAQLNVADNVNDNISWDEETFNQFCRNRLAAIRQQNDK